MSGPSYEASPLQYFSVWINVDTTSLSVFWSEHRDLVASVNSLVGGWNV